MIVNLWSCACMHAHSSLLEQLQRWDFQPSLPAWSPHFSMFTAEALQFGIATSTRGIIVLINWKVKHFSLINCAFYSAFNFSVCFLTFFTYKLWSWSICFLHNIRFIWHLSSKAFVVNCKLWVMPLICKECDNLFS
jgi:hypothetical protein